MLDVLADNPLLLLFAVAAVGNLLGRVSIAGFRLGVSAVLFTGLAASAVDARLRLPDAVWELGLILFVYTVGLASGPGFFSALRRRGLRDNGLALAAIGVAFTVTAVGASLLDLDATFGAGLFAGATTNTPALAGVVDALRLTAGSDFEQLSAEPVVAYSLAYPFGVVGMLLGISLFLRRRPISAADDDEDAAPPITTRAVRVTSPPVTVRQVAGRVGANANIVRVLHDGQVGLAEADTRLHPGDVVTIVGAAGDVDRLSAALGEPTDEHPERDRTVLDFRRVFVSNADVVGLRLDELDLMRRAGAVATRVRRGDVDLVARPDTVLQPGDRVRVVAPRDRLPRVSAVLGDSYRALGEFDITAVGLGIALGLLVGLIAVPLPGGGSFRLGFAGGPLIIGLLLGARERTGPFVWQMPYGANLTLRELGAVLFLAGIGTRSGQAFASTFGSGDTAVLVLAGVAVTTSVAALTLLVGHHVLHIPVARLIGMLAGIQTQPAVLAYAVEQSGDDRPNVGYATVFPIAMVTKIVLAQVLLVVLA